MTNFLEAMGVIFTLTLICIFVVVACSTIASFCHKISAYNRSEEYRKDAERLQEEKQALLDKIATLESRGGAFR